MELERDRLIRISEEAVFWIGEDVAEKFIRLKKLYSPKLIRAILKAEEKEFYSFSKEFQKNDTTVRQAITNKQKHMNSRVYYGAHLKAERIPCPF